MAHLVSLVFLRFSPLASPFVGQSLSQKRAQGHDLRQALGRLQRSLTHQGRTGLDSSGTRELQRLCGFRSGTYNDDTDVELCRLFSA